MLFMLSRGYIFFNHKFVNLVIIILVSTLLAGNLFRRFTAIIYYAHYRKLALHLSQFSIFPSQGLELLTNLRMFQQLDCKLLRVLVSDFLASRLMYIFQNGQSAVISKFNLVEKNVSLYSVHNILRNDSNKIIFHK